MLRSLCVAFACWGCGEQEIRAIEQLPLPATESPDDPEPPTVPDDPHPATPGDRGRVQVRDGNLFTDKGTRLRGVMFGLDNNGAPPRFTPALFGELSGETGLNAFHVYVENSTEATGVHVEEVDKLVEMTAAAGMYLVVGVGGGPAGGSFELEKLRATWSFYAPRYASRTHVIYEIQNIPDGACNVAYKAETLAMEREIYELIRESAPRSHIALLSFIAEPSGAALEADLDALDGVVDWANASVAFHSARCRSKDNLQELLAVTRARGIAAFASEMSIFTSFETTKRLESARVGWFNFEWFVRTRDLDAFRDSHTEAEVSWCPDFGKWPQDSATCGAP